MADGGPLSTAAFEQARWSRTANSLKGTIDLGRQITLLLAIVGATLETWGAQIHRTNIGLAEVVGYLGAASLAVAAVVRQWMMGSERSQAWIVARAGSESFKREMYLFRAAADPYSSGDILSTLIKRRADILARLQGCQKYRVEPKGKVDTPGTLTADDYLAERITGPKGQIQYFTRQAEKYAKIQNWLTGIEFLLALTGAFLGAWLTRTGQEVYGAWVAVITTITGAIASYALAQRYEQLTITFRTTADRLVGVKDSWLATPGAPLADLVVSAEAVLMEENQAWIAGADQSTVQTKNNDAARAATGAGE